MIGGSDTKQRILDVAERLFAEQGFAGTSLRSIISGAEVNLAAIHYHFHSKESLLESVLIRRIGPLNEERLKLLDQYEQASAKKGASLEDVLRAFFGPPMRLILSSREGRVFGKLVGRLHSETASMFMDIAKRHFGPISQRFRAALHRAVPEVPPEDLYWRMHFAVGVMAHTLSCWDRLDLLSDGMCKVSDADSAIPRLVDFVAAGFRAPVTRRRKPAHAEKRS
jgi:AcrR family transcriptional regulator